MRPIGGVARGGFEFGEGGENRLGAEADARRIGTQRDGRRVLGRVAVAERVGDQRRHIPRAGRRRRAPARTARQ